MAKQKSNMRQPPNTQIPRSSEQMMRDISRMLSDHDFKSAEEVNQFLQEQLVMGQPVPAQPRSNLDRAQDVIYQAHEAQTKAQMVKLARRALDISPDCADGYVMLAEFSAQTLAEVWALYEAGIKAGERALGNAFEKLKGHFWGHIETRPYMRARIGLATTLWSMGRLEEAAQHMDAMLELNPNDNQGVRLLYITLLLELGNSKRIDQLLSQYPSDWSAYWKYGEALHVFQKHGRGDEADDLLSDAVNYNRYVPLYLLGGKKLPKHRVASYSPRSEAEAIDYVMEGIRPWTKIEGALEWLADIFKFWVEFQIPVPE